MSKEETVRKLNQQGFNSNNQNNNSRISQSNSSTGYSSPSNSQSQNIFGNNNNAPGTSKSQASTLKEDYFINSMSFQKPSSSGQTEEEQGLVPRFRDDLSDLPSDELADLQQLDHHRTHSITSMDSYTSSGFPFIQRRESTYSSALSETSPQSPGLDSSQYSYYNNMGAGSQSSFEQTPSSFSETAALAHLTSQQLDEMMSLVITMVRRLDRLEDRISNINPDTIPPPKSKDEGNEKEPPFSWWTGLAFITVPILFGVAFKFLTGGKDGNNRRRFTS